MKVNQKYIADLLKISRVTVTKALQDHPDIAISTVKKVKELARKSALSYKVKNNQVMIVQDFTLEQPKTKEFTDITKNLKVDDKKAVFVLNERNNNVYLSSRNLQNSKIVTVSELSTYDIMNASALLFLSLMVSMAP